ncbi:MAG: cytochrome c [Ferruginibacter sp.]|nr:cytochrome c [Ferruginibacter sp.]
MKHTLRTICLFTLLITSASWLGTLQKDTLQQSMKRGEEVYATSCANCHMPQGEGVEGAFPPLAKTVYLKNQKRAIDIILHGQEGEIVVNGKTYNVPMAAMNHLTDQQVADVLNYVSNTWGNKNPMIKPVQVKTARK